MTTAFVDTSGILMLLDASHPGHEDAKASWAEFVREGIFLVTTSLVLVESFALVQRRLGLRAARFLHTEVVPLMSVEWVDASTYSGAAALVFAQGARDLSIVDCVSFQVMDRRGIDVAFGRDHHFSDRGMRLIP